MLIDHIGYFLYPTVGIFRVVGRIAFPSFVFGLIHGFNLTQNRKSYKERLFLLGVVSIFAWGRGFTYIPLNIGFSLLLMVYALESYRANDRSKLFLLGFLSLFVEYGPYGLILAILMYRYDVEGFTEAKYHILLLHIIFIVVDPRQVFALAFFPILWGVRYLVNKGWSLPKLNQQFSYGFYPIHILLLRLLG